MSCLWSFFFDLNRSGGDRPDPPQTPFQTPPPPPVKASAAVGSPRGRADPVFPPSVGTLNSSNDVFVLQSTGANTGDGTRTSVSSAPSSAPSSTHFFKIGPSTRFQKCKRPSPLTIDSVIAMRNAMRNDTLSNSLLLNGELVDDATVTRLDSDLDAAVSPSWFNLDGDMMRAKVIDVYDGDTVTLVFQFGSKMWKDKCRLTGVDTAEIRTRDADEKVRGLEARDWLRSKVLNKKVWVECGKWDKYGRLLGTIYLTSDFQQSVNQELINHGFAVPYFGGTKL